MKTSRLKTLLLAAALVTASLPGGALHAANHREAPLTALDHKADIADFFAFVSYDDPTKVTLILTVDPLLEPSNGPNYFPFDPEILYSIKIDNDHDAIKDISFEFSFATEIRLPGVFTGFVGAGGGVPAPANSPAPVPPGTPIVPPAITALDGPGSEGFSLRQTYTVTMVEGSFPNARRTVLSEGHTLFAVPSNVGPRTMPDYPSLYAQGIYDLGGGVKVFAGTVEDPFWIDLGAAFDSLNFRPEAFATGVAGVLTDAEDGDDATNFAPDDVAGFNVNAIAIEVPISKLTADRQIHTAGEPRATIGTWGTTSRPRVKIYGGPGDPAQVSGNHVQIQRMGNPLFNELIIGTGSKDKFSMSAPSDDAQFAGFALDPVLARVLNAVYDATVADLLRHNTGFGPTPAANRSRLGFLTLLDADPANDDPAGFPNGRRVSDDVTDIAARAVAGILAPGFNGFPHNRIGDGVNANDADYPETFPYLGYAHSGRDSRHVDPGEPGCTGVCP